MNDPCRVGQCDPLVETLKRARAEGQTEASFLATHEQAVSAAAKDASAKKGLLKKTELNPAGAQIARSAQADIASADKYLVLQQGAYAKGVQALKTSLSQKLSASDPEYRNRELRIAELKPLARDAQQLASDAAAVASELVRVRRSYDEYHSAKSDLSNANIRLSDAESDLKRYESEVRSAESAVDRARSSQKPGEPTNAAS